MLVSDIIVRIRTLTDTQNSTLVDDTVDLLPWINAAAAELHGLKTTLFEDYYTAAPTTSVVASGNTISLPSDFFKLRRLEYYVNTANMEYAPVVATNMAEIQKFNNIVYSSGLIIRRGYLILESNIFLLPERAATGTYRIWYAKKFTPYTTLADAITEPEGHEEYIVYDVALRVAQKDRTDQTELMAKKAAMKARIEGEAHNRDAGQPHHVVDLWDNDDC